MFYNSRTFRVLRFKFRRSVSRRMCVRRSLLKTFTMLAGTAEWSRGGHAQRQRLALYMACVLGVVHVQIFAMHAHAFAMVTHACTYIVIATYVSVCMSA